jgi:hypothetical protein
MLVRIIKSFGLTEDAARGIIFPTAFNTGQVFEIDRGLGREWVKRGLAVDVTPKEPETAMVATPQLAVLNNAKPKKRLKV